MPGAARFTRFVIVAALCLCSGFTLSARAQTPDPSFVTGAAQQAWTKWQAALTALLARDADGAETAFGELAALDPSPMRLALLAERNVERNENAGAVLQLEQDAAAGSLKDNGKKIFESLQTGREQLNQADDGWYFASIGRFDVANANFKALVAANPDPVALLEFANRRPERQEALVTLSDHPVVGESSRQVLRLLAEGERRIKADPIRVQQNIDRLAGSPRGFSNGLSQLKESGEFAVPFMVQYLLEANKKNLAQPILRALPQIDRGALNPLVQAFQVSDAATRTALIRAAGQIPYWQSVPYLLKVRDAQDTLPEVRAAVDDALAALRAHGVLWDANLGPAEAFYLLARGYYENTPSLAADPRLDTANVWYWNKTILQNVEVPSVIFDELMCMRACEEALRLNPDMKPALALWLAADFRREAQLPAGAKDHTRPENYPSAVYFAQSAGPEYCLMTLSQAVRDRDPAVALGAIEALQKTAGAASLIGTAGGHQPLADALSFPDRLVRIRAAIALARALPKQKFEGDQNLIPVMNEALQLFAGARTALVIDPNNESANAVAAALREAGYMAVTDATLSGGLQKARNEHNGADILVLASDMSDPALDVALRQLRAEFQFAAAPILVLTKPGQSDAVRAIMRSDPRVGMVEPGAGAEALTAAISNVAKGFGATAITPEVGTSLALEAASALQWLELAGNSLFDVAASQGALTAALGSTDADLRRAAGQALGLIASPEAQAAVLKVALDDKEAEPMREAMFAALAEGAKRKGNHLSSELVQQLTTTAEKDANLKIRTAASQALGALNLPGNPASAIIRNQYGG